MKIIEFVQQENIETDYDFNVLEKYKEDMASLAEYHDELSKARKLFRPDKKKKNYPWPGASNVNYPLLTSAATQFAARASGAIVQKPAPVKTNIHGFDPDGTKHERGKRVGDYMSYQILTGMSEWQDEMDRMLLALPIDGCGFKKTYRDESLARSCSVYAKADQVIVNKDTKDLESCPRISEEYALYRHEVVSKITLGIFNEVELLEDEESFDIIEQHVRADLDEDGYDEPYIVTALADSGEVLRVQANYDLEKVVVNTPDGAKLLGEAVNYAVDDVTVVSIQPIEYYTKYDFLPDPDGGFYGIGMGHLLGDINMSINSILNQLIDAGHLMNTGGGFLGRGLRLKSGTTRFTPGEWKKVDFGGDLRGQIMPLEQLTGGPSNVLFQLLGLLIDAGKEISSVQDVMTGGGGQNMPATTVLAQIEQGMKVFTAIYERIHRSFKKELSILYYLNGKYLPEEEYFQFMDSQQAVSSKDFASDMELEPVSDPRMATDAQKMAKAQIILQAAQYGLPVDPEAAIYELFSAAGFDNPEKFIAKPQGPSVQDQIDLAEQERKNRETGIKEFEAETDRQESLATIVEKLASSLEKMGKTEEAGVNNLLSIDELGIALEELRKLTDGNSGISGVEALAGNAVNGANPPAPPQAGGGVPVPPGPGMGEPPIQ